MGILEDVMKALERIPMWKRVNLLPDQLQALEERVKALEAKLDGPAGLACRRCNGQTLMFQRSESDPTFGDLGVQLDFYRCSSCNYEETKSRQR